MDRGWDFGVGAVARSMRRLVAVVALSFASGAWAQDSPQSEKAAASPRSPDACRLADAGTATIAKVLDGRTLSLSDGRVLRLAGIEVPEDGEPLAGNAASALNRLALDRDIAIRTPAGAEPDRHGRLVAHAFRTAEPDGPSLQRLLVGSGEARVAGYVGSLACAAGLLAAERAARTAGAGLWKLPYYGIRLAKNPGEILAERGRFTIVEGHVVSVRDSGNTIYVNFGRRWSEDFTVTVLKRRERGFAAEGLELRKLSGRNVRVRGTIEERGGPWIEATRPEQFEIAERN